MIEIYQKDNCFYCMMAVAELQNRKETFVEFKLDGPENIAKLKTKISQWETVPQIFIDNKHIGGYHELMKYYADQDSA